MSAPWEDYQESAPWDDYAPTQPAGETVTIPEGPMVSPDIQAQPSIETPGPTSLGSGISSVVEPAATMVTGAIAEPIAGLAGLTTLPFADASKATENIEAVRSALTYVPKTPEGMSALQKVAETLQPITETVEKVEQAAGDVGYQAGDALGGAIGKTIPAAAMMSLGLGPVRRALTIGKGAKSADKAIMKLTGEAAPTGDALKQAARGIYNELDDSGVVLRDASVDGLIDQIEQIAKKEGVRPILHPKSKAAIDAIGEMKGREQKITDIDTMREIADTAAASIDRKDARIGYMLKSKIDDFLDDLKKDDLSAGDMKDIGGKYKEARQLYHRAKKSELIDDAIEKASTQASGLENGLRIQFRQLLKNKKKMRGFTAEEKAAMRLVEKGTTLHNIAASLSKLGFGDKNVANWVGSGMGIYGGAQAGGPLGAVVVPLIGTLSGSLAKKLATGRANFANNIIKAGKDGKKVAEAYINSVPAKERNAAELTELLMRPGISMKNLKQKNIKHPTPKQKLKADAIFLVDFLQAQKNSEGNK